MIMWLWKILCRVIWGETNSAPISIPTTLSGPQKSDNPHVLNIDWYDQNKKQWIQAKILRTEWDSIKARAVARWCIQQFVTCPFCNYETDVISSNLKSKVSQGTCVGKDIGIIKRQDGSSHCEVMDTKMDIPVPPYFGAMMEDTENLDEHILCDGCGRDLNVQEAHWQFGT